MKKVLTIFFVILGIIFFCLILLGAYLFIFDPLNLKSLFVATPAQETPSEQTDQNALLSPTQEKALEAIGVDPASFPSSFTKEQEVCFVKVLGNIRVEEIKAGSTPTVTEFFAAKSCI